jgi:hypothetical protein
MVGIHGLGEEVERTFFMALTASSTVPYAVMTMTWEIRVGLRAPPRAPGGRPRRAV